MARYVEYKGHKTPYGKKHKLGTSFKVTYQDALDKYSPSPKIKKGKNVVVLDTDSGDNRFDVLAVVLKVSRHASKEKKMVTVRYLDPTKREIRHKFTKLIPVHTKNEFLTRADTKWFQVVSQDAKYQTLKMVLVPATDATDTNATDATAGAAGAGTHTDNSTHTHTAADCHTHTHTHTHR